MNLRVIGTHRSRNVFVEVASYYSLRMMDEQSIHGGAEWSEIKPTAKNGVESKGHRRKRRKLERLN